MAEVQALLINLEKDLLDPTKRVDKKFLEDIIDPDFIEYGQSGKIWNKDDLLNNLSNQNSVEIFTNDFNCLELASDVVLITYKSSLDKNFKNSSLRSSIWKKRQEKWKIVFHQGTSITTS